MTALGAWVVLPLIAVVVFTGAGLVAERSARAEVPSALVPGLGFCACIVLVGFPYALGLPAGVALALVCAAALAGLVLARGELRERFARPGYGAAAGLGAYLLYMAPLALSGEATFLGYNLLNDTAIHLALVDHTVHHGRDLAGLTPGSYGEALRTYLGSDYPLGSHELLATLQSALGLGADAAYQPFLSLSAALSATGIAAIARRAGAPGLAAAAAGFLAMTSQLVFSFALQGGIKELTFLTALVVVAALGAELLRSGRGAALLAVPAVAAYAIYGLPALAWLGPLAVVMVAFVVLVPGSPLRGSLLRSAAVALAAFVVLAIPDLKPSIDFYRHGESTLTGQAELGPLLRPIRTLQVAGIWIQGDYRQLPQSGGRRTFLLIGFALALAALGVALVLRRRAAGPLLLVLPALLAWLVVSRSGSPYVDAKLLVVLSPAVVLLACAGVAELRRLGLVPAAVAGLLLAGGLLASDALAYRVAVVAPRDRLAELGRVGDRFAGRGPLLVNEFEEYAKYFGRRAGASNPYERYALGLALLRDQDAQIIATAYGLDSMTLPFVERWRLIAVRRSPAESRPPQNYEATFLGRYYEVWEKKGGPPPRLHVPFGTPWSAASVPGCRRLRALRGPLTAAVQDPAILVDLARTRPLPAGWHRVPGKPMGLYAATGGTVGATVTMPVAGPRELWLKGSAHRDLELYVDGRRSGTARGLNGPGQWIDAGRVDLTAGPHRVELRRPRRSLAPGDAITDEFGPAALAPIAPAQLVSARSGAELCGRGLDWVESP